LLDKAEIVQDLSYISTNFAFLRVVLKQLQSSGRSIYDTLAIINNVASRLELSNGNVASKIRAKLESVLHKNPDLKIIQIVAKSLNGENGVEIENTVLKDFNPARISCLMYAPLTTVVSERSFSMNKAILSDKRKRMTMENFEMYLVAQFELRNNEISEEIDVMDVVE